MDTQPASGESRPAGEPEDAQALTTTSNKSAASEPSGTPTIEEHRARDIAWYHLKEIEALRREGLLQ